MNFQDAIRAKITTISLHPRLRQLVLLVWHTYRSFDEHRCVVWASSISFYTLFSLFPLLLAAVSLATIWLDEREATSLTLRVVGDLMPEVRGMISSTLVGVIHTRGTVTGLALLGLFWSGLRIFSVIDEGINLAWNSTQAGSMWRRRASPFLIFFATGLLFVLALGARYMVRLLAPPYPRSTHGPVPVSITGIVISDILPVLLSFTAFSLLYRYVPRVTVRWAVALSAALLATASYELAQIILSYYLRSVANYNLVYGSISVVIALLFWSYISALILLVGAEFAVQYARVFQIPVAEIAGPP